MIKRTRLSRYPQLERLFPAETCFCVVVLYTSLVQSISVERLRRFVKDTDGWGATCRILLRFVYVVFLLNLLNQLSQLEG
jgi:hypothetical protein